MRLIDGDELWESLRNYNVNKAIYLDEIKMEIDESPTINVVRCKDCKHYRAVFSLDKEDGMRCIREKYTKERKPNDFCSYGERRVDNEI